MTERWWAPQRPTVEPDAVVLAMLEPGDLGAAFMAAHRAGAAAIETVSKGALPSEEKLINALVTARRNVAGPVVDSISKSLDASYAGLLMRDVFDDAEQATLMLYRAAVSKGVSPPIAADRAAAVYGVPGKQLGKYMALATDPRANPVALVDAADRTLLTYASHLAESESSTVSKADQPRGGGQAYQEWDPREHPRDARGRFADAPAPPKTQTEAAPPKVGSVEWLRAQLGLGTGEPQKVADVTTEQVVEAPPVERVQRKHRQQRAQRVQRAQRPAPAAPQARAEQARADMARADPARAQAFANYLAQVSEQQRADIIADLKEKTSTALGAPLPDLLRLPKPNDRDVDTYFPIAEGLTIVSNTDKASGFLAKLFEQTLRPDERRDTSRMIFRMGHLLDVSNDPERSDSVYLDEWRGGEAREALARAERSREGYLEPDVEAIHPEEEGLARLGRERYNEMRRKEVVTETYIDASGHRVESVDREELNHIKVLPEYHRHGDVTTQDYLVHYNPADQSRSQIRTKPVVDEFVIVGSTDPRGRVEGATHTSTADQSYYRLDPNQAYEVINNPAATEQSTVVLPERMWDPVHKVVVHRWYITPIEEDDVDQILGSNDIYKAERQVFVEAQHPRDTAGRFVDAQRRVSGVTVGQAPVRIPVQVPTEEEQVTAPVRRRHRQQRTQRTQRVARPQAQPEVRTQARAEAERPTARAQRATAELSPFQRAQARAAIRARASRPQRTPDLPVFSDAHNYKVMTENEWTNLMSGVADEDIIRMHAGEQIPLNSYVDRIFRLHNSTHADSINYKLAGNVDQDDSVKSLQHKVVQRIPVRDARNLDKLADIVENIWEEHPEADRIEMIRRNNVLELSINVLPIGAQSVIEFDPDIVDDQENPPKLYLEYVGEYRARELNVRNSAGSIEAMVAPTGTATAQNGEGVIMNSKVHLYRVTTRRYRVTH